MSIVTGSSGFIGSALVEKLAEHYRVVGFDREIAASAGGGRIVVSST
jgi:nucleoside-diphosphate-sugar epimerase